MTDLLRWGSVGFPQTLPIRQRARQVVELAIRHRAPVLTGAATAVGIAAAAHLGIGYLRYERLVSAEQASSQRSERANADLQDALARLRDELGATNLALSAARGRIAALSDEAQRQRSVSEQSASSRADRIAQLTHALEQAQREMHLAEAQRVTLLARLSKAEADLAEWLARHQQAQAGIEQWQKRIQQLTADRDKAISERDQLRARVSELEKQSSRQPHQPPLSVATAQPPARPSAVPAAPVPQQPSVAAAAPPAIAATFAAGGAIAAAACKR